jgi:catalase
MRFDGNGGRGPNYEPNSHGGPTQSSEPLYAPLEVHGLTGTHPHQRHREDDDFVQAGNLYRIMSEAEKERLVAAIAANLGQVRRADVIARSVEHFRRPDPDYGARVAKAVNAMRTSR